MRRKRQVGGIRFVLKHIERFDLKWKSLVLLLSLAVTVIKAQWTNDEKDFYNDGGHSSPYEGNSQVPTINGYGATVKQVNGYNVLDLEKINRDSNLQRFITSESSYGNPSTNQVSYGNSDADEYSIGYGSRKSSYGNEFRQSSGPYGKGYSNFRIGRRGSTVFYGDNNGILDGGGYGSYGNPDNYNDNDGRECVDNNPINCAGQSGYGYEGAGKLIGGATVMQPILPDNTQMTNFEGQGSNSFQSGGQPFGQSGSGYGSGYGGIMARQSRNFPTDGIPYIQNYGSDDNNGDMAYGGMSLTDDGYGSGFMNNNQVNNADYYEIPSNFDQINDNNGNGLNNNYNNNNNNMFNAQNMKKYAEYLELINKKYGIGMPGVDRNTQSDGNFIRTDSATVTPLNIDSKNNNVNQFGGAKTSDNSNIKQPEYNSNGNGGYSNGNMAMISYGGSDSAGGAGLGPHRGQSTSGVISSDGCEKLSPTEASGYGSFCGSRLNGGTDNSYDSGYKGQQGMYGKNKNVDQWSSGCANSYPTAEKNIEEAMQQPPNTKPNAINSPGSIQTLTQQIRRLPSVFYLQSTDADAVEEEQLLRKTYGLPLVAFYVNKMENPQAVEKNLEQLTAFAKMPYLFICGTFIGSKEHIETYHRNNQIPKLVEFVCSDEKKSKRLRRRKKRPERITKLQKQ